MDRNTHVGNVLILYVLILWYCRERRVLGDDVEPSTDLSRLVIGMKRIFPYPVTTVNIHVPREFTQNYIYVSPKLGLFGYEPTYLGILIRAIIGKKPDSRA